MSGLLHRFRSLLSRMVRGSEVMQGNNGSEKQDLMHGSELMHPARYPFEEAGLSPTNKYYFISDSGLKYEVYFSTVGKSYLSRTLNFGVVSDSFQDDEYAPTNKGELYRVIATVASIVEQYQQSHPLVNTYSFTGIGEDDDESDRPSTRAKLYYRAAQRIVNRNSWRVTLDGNLLKLVRRDA